MVSKTTYKLQKSLNKAKYKTKRFLAKNHYYIPLLVIILLLVGIICVCLSPFMYQYIITYEGDTDRDTTYIYNDIIYDYAIYVHKDGNNLNGESWETAYTTINKANIMISLDLDDKTIIFVGIGVFDVYCIGQLNITKNVHIVGSGRDATIFTNTHDDADYVFNITRYCKIENVAINVTDAGYSGIMVYGNYSDVRLIHMRFIGAADTPVLLHLYSGDHGEFEDLHFDGIGTTRGIWLNGSFHNHFIDIEVVGCKSAILLWGADTDSNYFSNIRIFYGSIGIHILSGNNQHFEYIFFEHCGQAVKDEVGDSYWFELDVADMTGILRPDDSVGVVVTTGGAGVYGVDVLIYDSGADFVDCPFYIVAVMYEPSSKERYCIRVAEGATYFYTTIIEAKSADEVNRLTLENPIIFNTGDNIYCSVMSETGGDTVDIWIEIIWIF